MIFSWLKRRRRRRLLAQPFPAGWLRHLQANLPCYAQLTPDEQRRLQGLVQVFIAERNWEGCGGLVLTDEMRVTIAGAACVLLLGLARHDYFARVLSVLVYPGGFVAPVREPLSDQPFGDVYLHDEEDRLGEASPDGAVVLAWDEVQWESRHPGSGHNLVWHEFAHQLDMQNRAADGVPPLGEPALAARWQEVMSREYRRLASAERRRRRTLLDPYGAQDEAEFFAVVTECFFDRPSALAAEHPELYDVLRAYYGQDPAQWGVPRGT